MNALKLNTMEEKNMVDMKEVEKIAAKVIAEMKKVGISTDETTGKVGFKEEKDVSEDADVYEHSDSGRGLSVYKDYTKIDSNKYKRLSRD